MTEHRHLIEEVHVVISGFLQYEGKPNGMIRLWRDIHHHCSGPECLVLMKTWNDDMNALAEFIWRLSIFKPRVCVYGYSWGGAASAKLAGHLGDRGIRVDTMVLSDAVYRHGYWLGNWRALVPFSSITVDNTDRVFPFRQGSRLGKISGHEILPANERTKVYNTHWFSLSHQHMDDLRAFHEKSRLVAGAV